MKFAAKKFNNFILKFVSVGLILISHNALSHVKTVCNLGQKCSLSSQESVIIPVSKSDGTRFECTIFASSKRSIIAAFEGGKNFSFEPRYLDVHKSIDKKVKINGTFIAPDAGEINVSMVLANVTEGAVQCIAE